ncbi:hypothetical protein Hanom_Chr12g01084131 [Helianthus anomalus]
MKWRSTSMCFILLDWVGGYLISVKSFRTHRASARPRAIPRNSASALERATTFCFLLLHVTRFPPTRVKYPDVDLRFPLSHAQFASVYTWVSRCLFVLKRTP